MRNHKWSINSMCIYKPLTYGQSDHPTPSPPLFKLSQSSILNINVQRIIIHHQEHFFHSLSDSFSYQSAPADTPASHTRHCIRWERYIFHHALSYTASGALQTAPADRLKLSCSGCISFSTAHGTACYCIGRFRFTCIC